VSARGFSRLDFEAEQIAALRDEGMPLLSVNLRTGNRLTGLDETDILRAVICGEIEGRRSNGRIILLWESLKNYVLSLPEAK